MLTYSDFLTEYNQPNAVVHRFHRDAYGFPAGQRVPPVGLRLYWSRFGHAADALRDDGIEIEEAPRTLPQYELIETTYNQYHLVKWLVRFSFDKYRDLVVSIAVEPYGKVVTCWVNASNDQHRTLRRDQYTDPNKFPVGKFMQECTDHALLALLVESADDINYVIHFKGMDGREKYGFLTSNESRVDRDAQSLVMRKNGNIKTIRIEMLPWGVDFDDWEDLK